MKRENTPHNSWGEPWQCFSGKNSHMCPSGASQDMDSILKCRLLVRQKTHTHQGWGGGHHLKISFWISWRGKLAFRWNFFERCHFLRTCSQIHCGWKWSNWRISSGRRWGVQLRPPHSIPHPRAPRHLSWRELQSLMLNIMRVKLPNQTLSCPDQEAEGRCS